MHKGSYRRGVGELLVYSGGLLMVDSWLGLFLSCLSLNNLVSDAHLNLILLLWV